MIVAPREYPVSQLAGALRDVLADAQRRGFLGPAPLEGHYGHSLAFADADVPLPGRALDLGSGGGVPGLVLSLAWSSTQWVLLDGSTTRAAFLSEAIDRLGLSPRVTVFAGRAENHGRGPARESYDVVVARSFASPAVTAECAAPLLRVGGHLLVAEPPGGDPTRWPPDGLALLGMAAEKPRPGPVALQVLRQVEPAPSRYPRRVGVPAKRPLF